MLIIFAFADIILFHCIIVDFFKFKISCFKPRTTIQKKIKMMSFNLVNEYKSYKIN